MPSMQALGFVFTGEDKGLDKTIDDISKGLETMNDRASMFGSTLESGLPKFDEIFNSRQLQDFAESIDEDSERLRNAFRPVDMKAFSKGFTVAEQRLNKFKDAASSGLGGIGKGFKAVGHAGDKFFGFIGKTAKTFGSFFRSGKDGAKQLVSGFGEVNSIIERMDKLIGLSRIQTFVQGAIFDKLHGIADKLSRVSSEGINLTTGYEAQMQAMSAAARKSAANFGVTGKALDQMTGAAAGMAKGMNISTEVTTDAVVSFSKATSEFAAIGIDSAVTLAKFSDLTGISATQMRETLLKARKELKFDDSQIKLVTGSFLSMGKAIGNVPAALSDMPEVLKMLGELKSWGVTDTKVLASFAAQTAALARGFKETGKGADEARQLSLTLTKAIIDSKANIARMFAGTENDLSEFTQNLGISVGDINEAFDLMKKGPEGMMTGLAKMVLSLKKQGKDVTGPLTFLHARLEQAIGPEAAAQMTTFLQNATEETLSMMSATKVAGQSLGQFAKEGWRSTKTLQEAFEDTKNAFISNFRNIARKQAVEFVQETGKEFNKFNKQLQGMVARGGPLAAVITKLSEMHQIGALALIPKTLRPMATLLGTISEQLLPMAAQLGALGFRFSMLVSPVGLLVLGLTAAVGWFLKLKSEGMSTAKAIEQLGKDAGHFAEIVKKYVGMALDFLLKLTGKLLESAKKIDWAALFKEMFSSVKGASGSVIDTLVDVFGVIIDVITGKHPKAKTKIGQILGNLTEVMSLVVRGLITALGTVDWGGLASKAGNYLLDTLLSAVKYVTDALAGGSANPLGEFLVSAASKLGSYAEAIGSFLIDALDKVFKAVAGMNISGLVMGLVDIVTKIALGLLNNIGHLIEKLADKFPEWKKLLGEKFEELLSDLPGKLRTWLYGLGDKLKEALPSIVKALVKLNFEIFKGLFWDIPKFILTHLPEIFTAIGEILDGALKAVYDAIVGIFKGLWDAIVSIWDDLFGHSIIPDWFENAFEYIGGVLTAFIGFFKEQWQAIKEFILGVWDGVKKAVDNTINGIKEAISFIKLAGNGAEHINVGLDKISDLGKAAGDELAKVKDAAEAINSPSTMDPKVAKMLAKELPKIFKDSFEQIKKLTAQDFIPYELKVFDEMIEKLRKKLADMFEGILNITQVVMKSVSDEVGRTLGQLKAIEGQLENMRAAKASAQAELVKEGEPYKPPPGIEDINTRAILEHLDRPEWYKDYKMTSEFYLKQIADGIAGLKAMGLSPSTGNGTSTVPGAKKAVNAFKLGKPVPTAGIPNK